MHCSHSFTAARDLSASKSLPAFDGKNFQTEIEEIWEIYEICEIGEFVNGKLKIVKIGKFF